MPDDSDNQSVSAPVDPSTLTPSQQQGQNLVDNPPAQQQPKQADTDSPGESKEYKDAIGQYQDLLKRSVADEEENKKNQDWAHEQMQQILSQPMPQMPSYGQANPQNPNPAPQIDRAGMKTSMTKYLAVAIPLALILGRHNHAGWGAMAGIGEGMKAISAGYTDRAKQAANVWKAQNDQAIKMGKQRMDYYKDTMQNRKLDLDEKMQLIQHAADMTKDQTIADKAEAGDWKNVVDELAKHEKIIGDAEKTRAQHEETIMKSLGSGSEYEDYKQRLLQQSPQLRKDLESGDTAAYNRDYDSAMQKYPWTKFLAEKQKASIDEAKKKHDAEMNLNLDEGSAQPGETPEAQQLSPDQQKKLDDIASRIGNGG